MSEPAHFDLHADAAFFREAVNYTVARTGFTARLIEKDYFGSVLLSYLAQHGGDRFVFKGGTCLAKVHAGFYRLSEDLDFTVPVPVDARRSHRRRLIAGLRDAMGSIADQLPVFKSAEPLKGAKQLHTLQGRHRLSIPHHRPS